MANQGEDHLVDVHEAVELRRMGNNLLRSKLHEYPFGSHRSRRRVNSSHEIRILLRLVVTSYGDNTGELITFKQYFTASDWTR